MMLVIGTAFLLMGLLCGGAMAVAPLGVIHALNGVAAYLLFPGLCVLGYLFLAVGARTEQVAKITQALGAALLLLALIAAAILVILALNIRTAEGSSLSLWYVLALGTLFGGAGMSIKSGNKV